MHRDVVLRLGRSHGPSLVVGDLRGSKDLRLLSHDGSQRRSLLLATVADGHSGLWLVGLVAGVGSSSHVRVLVY